MAEYTPMMQQYLDIKAKYPDCILFFRLGDFYEMFMEDAEEASRLLEITLTGREAGPAGRVPMCGVPYHAAESYLAKLIVQGKKVAICEQVEDPSQAKGLVKRDVVRVVTPGSVLENALLDSERNNYLASLCRRADTYGLAAIDLSTGEVLAEEYTGAKLPSSLIDDYLRLLPVELILSPELEESPALQRLCQLAQTATRTVLAAEAYDLGQAFLTYRQQYGESSEVGLPPQATRALGAAIDYLRALQRHSLPHLRPPSRLGDEGAMYLDLTTTRNLELFKGNRSGGRDGSLLSVIDLTVTSAGSRQLRRWIAQPLRDPAAIGLRLDAVEELKNDNFLRDQIRQLLREAYDLERLASRVATSVANPRDLLSLQSTLQLIPRLTEAMRMVATERLRVIAQDLNLLPELTQELGQALEPDPPVTIREGGIIAVGYNQLLDELRGLAQSSKIWLADLEARERQRTGIKSLKVGYNKVFGYYLEVTKANLEQVPEDYVRKQTLVNAERFITQELKSREEAILSAEERQKALEYELFVELRERTAAFVPAIQRNAQLLAELDCLQSLAEVAARRHYSRPVITRDGSMLIRNGRHPVVEDVVGGANFVPNDLSIQQGELLIITGPNMGGKSTYMRQIALIVLLAQMGSFVPATEARLSLVDRIFTRVGAADDLFSGQSTFMVEMQECKVALAEATAQSLILFDELGRGTSTYDGMALAEAIIEYVHNQIGAKTLFSTHYHQLTALADRLPRVRNLCCQVVEERGELIFLRRVIEGKADRSYGLNVAKMAGLPGEVIARARQILRRLEERSPLPGGPIQLGLTDFMEEVAASAAATAERQSSLTRIGQALRNTNINELTPLAALQLIAEWQRQIEEEKDHGND